PSPPKWVRTAIAAAMGIVFLTGLGAALSADAPEPVLVSAELRGRAAGEARGAPERRLARAEAEASKLESRASRLAGVEASGREALGPARRRLSRAEGRLASAEGAAERYSGLLDKQEEKGRREACDPNYTGCLDPNAIDYDCEGGSGDGPLYTGPVEVIESDPYDLDRDGDGHGCE
ncbi:MAG TPA: hypothetical protein VFC52_01340, partial [Solirubrobacterales bacterium]|nr:hypothetical protein [Solirubrobacterales bacterium]